jgi:ankyrin repeat protein
MRLDKAETLAVAVTEAIQTGDTLTLGSLLADHPSLATAVVIDERGNGRTLLHLASDFPGHLPQRSAVVTLLTAAGAPVDGRFEGFHGETALHWAASNDDVELVDTLLDLGANIESDGGVIGNGTPLADAVAFGQWQAARRLIFRGAQASLWQAAALGLMDQVVSAQPTKEELDNAFWCACHGDQRETAEYLLEQGASLNWLGHDGLTPLQAALRSGAEDLATWLRSRGAI